MTTCCHGHQHEDGFSGLGGTLAELIPEFRARATETETGRTLPDDLARRAKEGGLFDLLRPRSLGGLGLDTMTFLDTAIVLSHADSSVGFLFSIATVANALFAWLDPTVARHLIGDSIHFSATCTPAPLGTAIPDGHGGFIVSGRWPFSTGCKHADWFEVGVVVMDGDGPRLGTDGAPQRRLAIVRPKDARIIDTWQASGLRGTGSHDVTLEGLTVPEEHTIPLEPGGARVNGPLGSLSITAMVALTGLGFPLGIARRALDEFTELAKTKKRGLIGTQTLLARDEHVQAELGRAEAELRAATAYARQVARQMWTGALEGREADENEMELAGNHAVRVATSVVDTVCALAGASISRDAHPLERCQRDVHTARQHGIYGPRVYKRYARHLMDVTD
jgi:alkylation response protein AidB-like acyl-CoA dehydrogenase